MVIQLPAMRWVYILSTSNLNQSFYIWLLSKQISLSVLGTLSDCSFQVMKLFHDILEVIDLLFATYYLYYKEKLGMIMFIYNFFHLSPLYKLLSLSTTLSDCVIKFAIYHPYYKNKFVGNSTSACTCAAEPDLSIIKKNHG